MNRIVITSNPFGYGPTGQAIVLIKELLKNKNINPSNIHFIGSDLCREIIEKELVCSKITICDLNERNVLEIKNYLQNFESDTVCIGFQNRFIIEVANKLKIKNIFIDGLGWFWKKIPISHLSASNVYWTNFPNLLHKEKNIPNNVSVIGLIQESCTWTPDKENPFYLVSLGGCINPLVSGLQENYLILAMKVFNKISSIKKINIKVVLGNTARIYLEKNNLVSKNISVHSYEHSEMMKVFSKCQHHFSIGGQSSTMEALQSKIPTTFYLPSNLSQIAFQKIFQQFIPGEFYCNWQNYTENTDIFNENNEEYIINVINEISSEIAYNEIIINKIANNCIQNIDNPAKEELFKLVSELKFNGAEQIISEIIK